MVGIFFSCMSKSRQKVLTAYSVQVMGKSEGQQELWHGHVTAVTVAPEFRRLGLARLLMQELEDISRDVYNAYFVDLFVRKSNSLAINMYHKLGYSV
jgi:N-terminal acetyltransferase B complex catalytic subunit